MDAAQVETLWDVLGLVPDQHSRHGRRYTLQSVLALVVGALLAGRKSLAAIARWGRSLSDSELQQLGIEREKAPCHATYHNVLKELKVQALEKCLGRWVSQGGQPGQSCLDGKTLRASRSADYPAVHLLALYSERLQGGIAQMPVAPAQNKITTALRLLKEVPLEGMILTGDAEFAQKDICRQLTDGGGDYFFVVKDNQPGLKEHIETAFSEPFSPWEERMWEREVDTARTLDKGHGRLEVRTLEATERLSGYLDWPGLRQVCRIVRERRVGGRRSSETVYAITRLSRERANAGRLLEISRRHWGIENRLHCVRDLTMAEDRCRVRAPAAAQALAGLRNTALTVLLRLGFENIRAGLEHCCEHRQKLIHLLRYGITK